MQNHKKWQCILSYVKDVPINVDLIDTIDDLLTNGENVLLMIAKENPEDNPQFTPEEKFKAICDIFPEETKTGKLIISKVPDIENIIKMDL